MPRQTQEYSDELKAALIAAWKAGASQTQLMTQFDVPKSTLRGWVSGLTRSTVAPKKRSGGASEESASASPAPAAVVVAAPVVELEQAETIDDIAWNHVRAADLATTAILRKVTDPEWLDRQDAGAVAKLYGVLADKEFRLLAAFRPRDDDEGRSAGTEQSGESERVGEDAQPEVG